MAEIATGLPDGVTILAVYKRSDLIPRAIKNLTVTLLEESVIVALVCVVFLMHVRSALVAILMLPVGVLISFSRLPGAADLYGAVMEGAVERVRPKVMTVMAIMGGLLPIMWGSGTGSEVMSRIATPMVGGMVSSTVLTLAVNPALYALVKQWQLRREPPQPSVPEAALAAAANR